MDTSSLHPAPDGAPAQAVRAWVGLGSNMGDSLAYLRAAVAALQALPRTRLTRVSRLYRSAPVDAQGADYFNAVAELSTQLTPEALLHALLGIELGHGRQRPFPNAPRTLDLDLLLQGQAVRATPELVLPHPRMHLRAFVLHPLLELEPGLSGPAGSSLGPLRDHLSRVADQALSPVSQPHELWWRGAA